MMNVDQSYPKLVKEFIVNLLQGFNDVDSGNYKMIQVRRYYFSFSPSIISEYIFRGRMIKFDHVPSLKTIAR